MDFIVENVQYGNISTILLDIDVEYINNLMIILLYYRFMC
jgi:hypothetical protein